MSVDVSIIIPTRNRQQYVQKAVQSCIEQDIENLEIIVVDDGSTDGTVAALSGFNENIKIVCINPSGAQVARNTGASVASGKYIKFLDSDDFLQPGAVRVQFERMKEIARIEPNGENMIVCGFHSLVNKNGQKIKDVFPMKSVRKNGEYNICDIIEKNPATTSPLYPKEVVLAVGGFNENVKSLQDYDFAFRASVKGFRYIFFWDNVYCMRMHESDLRVSNSQKCQLKMRNQFSLFRAHVRIMNSSQKNINRYFTDRALASRAASIIRRCLRNGDIILAYSVIKYTKKSISNTSWSFKLAVIRANIAGAVSQVRDFLHMQR